jgi:hypothetical protein
MWALSNRTPFAAERSFVRDRRGAEVLLVVVKATFGIGEDGSLSPADEQEPIHAEPVFTGEPASSSLRYEADFYLDKPATDVIVHGTAYARGGQATVALEATLRVGSLTKTLAVIGNRRWQRRGQSITLSEPEPFVSMPICYERAYGGTDGDVAEPFNPVGTGFAKRLDDLVGAQAPNLERPGALVPQAGEASRPVGLGPIARAWQPRLGRAGGDEGWRETVPLLPANYDARHECCAPDDQQVDGYLQGGEPVELVMLTPSGRLETKVPRLSFVVETNFGGSRARHTPRLHTLSIEPDERRLIAVFHTAVPCHRTLYALRRILVEMAPDG